MMRGRVLVPGRGSGEVLLLTADTSFWGSVDPRDGRIMDTRHPQHGEYLHGRVLVLRRSIGSSSGSAILVELLERGCGPAGIILGEADQILTLGAVVAGEMGYAAIPVLQLDPANFGRLGGVVSMTENGVISADSDAC